MSIGEIDKPIVGWLWLVSGILWGIRVNLKYGIIPKREHLRDPNGSLFIATWNVFSHAKWTDEGVAFHKRIAVELGAFAATWVLAYFILAALF